MRMRRPWRDRPRRFVQAEEGATAIEFAFIAPVLIFALYSLIEIGLLGMMMSNLDNAVIEASRRIRTGRADMATSASTFEDQICTNMGDNTQQCRDRLMISVEKYAQFAAAGAANTAPAGQFDAGAAGDIIVVKANYTWPLITPYVASAYHGGNMTEVVLASRMAFKNEPFE